MPEVDQSLRAFSKQHFPEERQKAATAIWKIREPISTRKKKLVAAKEKLTEREQSFRQVNENITNIELDLSKLDKSLVARLFKKDQIDFVKRSLAARMSQRTDLRYQVESAKRSAEGISGTDLGYVHDWAKGRLQSFYGEMEKKRQAAQQAAKQETERRTRQEFIESEKRYANISFVVKEMNRGRNLYFVHGIRPDSVPVENSLLCENATWKEKLAILLTMQPTLSASTVETGDRVRNMWSRMGVVLREGQIELAEQNDAGTQAKAVNHRDRVAYTNPVTRTQMYAALNKRDRHNEFSIARPGVAGFYVTLDEPEDEQMKNRIVSVSEIAPFVADELGMPLFLLKKRRNV